jgi:prophage maintenance system killer protein
VLIEHLARNHPLPDGNKRVSFALMILFLERNGQRWGDPDHDRDVHMVEQIASGQAHRREVLEWIPPASRDDRARLVLAQSNTPPRGSRRGRRCAPGPSGE